MPSDNPFRAVAALGYSALLPIVPPGAPLSANSTLAARANKPGKDPRGKAPGVLRGDGAWSGFDWMRQAPANALDIERWHSWGASVGLRMGDGLTGLDVDTMEPKLAAIALRIACETIPGSHAVRIGRSPKFLILLRLATHVPYRMIEFVAPSDDPRKPSRIELLARGKQAVVAGIHPATGKPYTWQPAMPRHADVVQTTPETLALLFERLAAAMPGAPAQRVEGGSLGVEAPQAQLRGNAETVRRAIEALPNTTKDFPSRESYRDVGYALKAALPDDETLALSLFEAWSDRWQDPPDGEGNVDGYAEAMWRTLRPPFRIGASWLYERLEAVSGVPAASAWLEPIAPAPAGSLFDLQPREPVAAVRLDLIPFADMARRALQQSNVPLVKGLLDCGTASMLYAPSNAGKTFVALDVAMHIALGIAWNGMRVRQMAVVYLAMEGGLGISRRVEALRRHFRIAADVAVPFHFYPAPLDLLRAEGDIAALVEAVRGVEGVGLVVIDTTSRALAGGDENSSTDMGLYVRNTDAVRTVTSAHVMHVHHTGKDVARGARGWSGMRAAIDTELEIIDGSFTATKQRDMEMNVSLAFDLVPVELGSDADGDAIKSCVVKWSTAEEAKADVRATQFLKPASRVENAVAQAVADVAAVAPGYVATNEAILERLHATGFERMTYNSLRAAQSGAKDKGLIYSKAPGKWCHTNPSCVCAAPSDDIQFLGENQGAAPKTQQNAANDLFQ